MLLLVSFVWFIWKTWRTASQPSRDLGTNTTDNIVEAKHSRHAEKCMNSTGRWVHGMTKHGTDCNHRDTAWNEKRTSWELFLTVKWIGPLMDRIKKYKVSWKKKNKKPLMWFPDGSPGFGRMKKQQRVFFFFWWWKSIPVQCATQQPDSSCLCRRDILEKVLEQFLHWYFFTSEWVCRWALRLDLSAKALLQWGQANGFSPVRGEMRKKTLLGMLHRQIWIEMIFSWGLLFWAGCNTVSEQ